MHMQGRTPLSNETIRNAVQKWNEGGSACEEVAVKPEHYHSNCPNQSFANPSASNHPFSWRLDALLINIIKFQPILTTHRYPNRTRTPYLKVADEFGEIGDWDVSNVTSMSGLFTCANSFNDDISRWDTSSVVDMSRIFNAAISFNQPLEGWDTSSVTNMCSAFDSADSFNQPLEGWDTSSVTDMRFLFYNASAFNQSLEGWDTSSVTAMSNMFFAAGLMTSREKPSWYQHRAEMSGDQRHAAHPSWF